MDSPEGWVELDDPGILEEVANLKAFLERGVKGQTKAIGSVCKIYEYHLTLRWLEERQGPIGTFMFLGPSGVGKTELSRMLSQYFMGSVDAMIKIDCSAFSQPHMIHALIGAPHSYVGWYTPPILSKENIFRNIKKPKSAKSDKWEILENQKRILSQKIKNLNDWMIKLELDFDTKKKFSEALIQYHYVLHGNPEESLDNIVSVSDLLKDSQVKSIVLSMLNRDARIILENNLSDSVNDAATLLGLIIEIMKIISDYREAETNKNIFMQELLKLNNKQKRNLIGTSDDKQEEKTDSAPEMVILFDEIEKGSQALHNLLLQIMEDGRLTLANGKVTDLRNAFIIMTSNVGSSAISELLKRKRMGFAGSDKSKKGFSEEDNSFEDLESRVLKVAEREMEKTFSSAFRGRIDETLVFRPLTRQAFYDILNCQIEIFTQSLNVLELDLIVDQEVKDIIIAQSLHRPEVGARLLSHKFKSLIKIPLGHRLAKKGDIKGTIRVSVANDNKIKFLIEE